MYIYLRKRAERASQADCLAVCVSVEQEIVCLHGVSSERRFQVLLKWLPLI